MLKLLVLADDLTGALDTCVQFVDQGVHALVTEDAAIAFETLDASLQVLVVNLGTRHMRAQDAHRAVHTIAARALRAGIAQVYKKTDSGLRGNIGSELDALMAAAGGTSLAFVPAFPRMNRVVRAGRVYIDGLPVTQSVFARDLFEPVRHDAVSDIIAAQSARRVISLGPGGDLAACPPSDAILVFDAETDADIAATVAALRAAPFPLLLAGCAGLAHHLCDHLGLARDAQGARHPAQALVVATASISEINWRQIHHARARGWPLLAMSPALQLSPAPLQNGEAQRLIRDAVMACRRHGRVIVIPSADAQGLRATQALAKARGLPLETVRRRVAANEAAVTAEIHRRLGGACTLVVSGGDTLQALLSALGCAYLAPVCQIRPGVVYASAHAQGRRMDVVTKSGSFGDEDVLDAVAAFVGSCGP